MSLMSRDQVSHQAAAGSDRPSAVCLSEALREPIFALMRGWALTLKYGRYEEIRVGIVGANAKSSWAKASHVPAINGLPGLKLEAVATRNEQSAREAAEAFGADRWFSDPFAMIRDDRIDVIAIAVRVPAHRELGALFRRPSLWATCAAKPSPMALDALSVLKAGSRGGDADRPTGREEPRSA